MAQVTSKRNNNLPVINTAGRHIQKAFSLTTGDGNSGDNIEVMGIPVKQKGFLRSISVRVSGTLGAGVTLTGQVNQSGTRTALTGATTAAAASKVDSSSNINVPFSLNGGEVIELLIGGGNIAATATVTVDMEFVSRS